MFTPLPPVAGPRRRRIVAAACAALALSLTLAAGADQVEVVLDGLEGELEDNVRARLALALSAQRSDLSESVIRRLYRRAPEQIRVALQPFGHYRPVIDASLADDGEGRWLATLSVAPGDAVVLAEVTVQIDGPGRDDPAFARARAQSELVAGETLRHQRYEALKGALRQAAAVGGYLDATFTESVLRVDPEAGTASAALRMATGPRFRFGELLIDQDVITDDLLRRFIAIEAGEPFDQQRLLDAQFALRDSGYFASVELRPRRDRTIDLRVPVEVTATARPPRVLQIGAGFSTDEGPRVSLSRQNRRMNLRGHRLAVDLRLGTLAREFSTRYSLPGRNPRSDRLSFNVNALQESLGSSTDSQRFEAGAVQTRVIGEWQRVLQLQLSNETSDFGEETREDTLLIPGVSYTRTRGDDVLRPRRGSRVGGALRASGNALGADTDFVRLLVNGKSILPVGDRARVLLRGEVGTLFVEDFTLLPASLRFFTGGDRTVRGFPFDDLGPRDPDGDNVGGQHLLVGSAEIEWPVVGRWGGAWFVDAGNALSDFSDPLEVSAGAGVRWLSPFGLVRLDFAKPLTQGDEGLRIHLSIGPDL